MHNFRCIHLENMPAFPPSAIRSCYRFRRRCVYVWISMIGQVKDGAPTETLHRIINARQQRQAARASTTVPALGARPLTVPGTPVLVKAPAALPVGVDRLIVGRELSICHLLPRGDTVHRFFGRLLSSVFANGQRHLHVSMGNKFRPKYAE